jgi:N-ethylmaleimide reductase
MQDSDPVALFSYVLKELENRKIGYVHLIEPRATSAGGDDKINQEAIDTSKLFRKSFSGVLISAGGYNPQNAQEAIELGVADAVAFGRIYIANPDLVKRVKEGKELNKYDRATFYGGGEKGYTDYPTLA